ncbi:MAG: hypothetical protein HY300_12190 [Verrucomicrobia bacterium]|nr:hypothetical protein [Verrucomicrobiota bacterium]
MNHEPETTPCCGEETRSRCAYVVAVVGALLIVAVLLSLMDKYTRPAASAAPARAKERAEKLAEVRRDAGEALASYGWQDKTKGLVRLPVDRAMELTVQAYGKDAEAARSNLIVRVEKATALPPKPPEKKSEFE